MALGYAVAHTSPIEGGDGDLPRPDRLRVPPPQATDHAQIVGAAAGHRDIAVPARGHEALGEVARRFVDPSAAHGDRAPRIERLTLDRPLVPPTRLVQRQIEPPQSFVVAPQPRLRAPVQQREARRIRQLAPVLRTEELDDLGVVSGRGELSGPLDYQCRRVHRVCPLPSMTRSEEHTSELQSQSNLVCRLLLEKKKKAN